MLLGMQDMFRRLRGVVSTRVGYTGGDIANPSYGNHQGHAEAIEIVLDPAVDVVQGIGAAAAANETTRETTADKNASRSIPPR
jgi:peptide methionine sulfoxide reductase MsrA